MRCIICRISMGHCLTVHRHKTSLASLRERFVRTTLGFEVTCRYPAPAAEIKMKCPMEEFLTR